MATALIDKALNLGSNMGLTETGDFQTVLNKQNILQAAQIRCLSLLGSWRFDIQTFGNELGYYLEEKSPFQLTKEVAGAFVEQALRPMITDGRVDQIQDVSILDITSTSVTLKIQLVLGSQIGTLAIEVNNFGPTNIPSSGVTNI